MIRAAAIIALIVPTASFGYYAENAREPSPYVYTQHHCLALAAYHEAKGEGREGKEAVAYVVLNRYHDDEYPNDVCDVVYQGRHDSDGNPIRNACQFSWYCDGKSDEPGNEENYLNALLIAIEVTNTYDEEKDPTLGATMFHAEYVNPSWSSSFERTIQIGNHIFYR